MVKESNEMGGSGEKAPWFYGSVTVGERGQVAIPVEARRELKIIPNSKLLVFRGPSKNALMFMKAESLAEFITNVTAELAQFEQDPATDSEGPKGQT